MLPSFFFICLSTCCSDCMISIILSSRSCIHSACHLVCYLLLLDWFVSQQLNCLFLIILSLYFIVPFYNDMNFYQSINLVSVFITSFLNLGSSRLVSSISLFGFSGVFSCSFNWESSFAFSFCLTFFVY